MKRYVPDLAHHASLCEANYVRLQRLLQNITQTSYHFCWFDGSHNQIDVDICVSERFRYTLTLHMVKSMKAVPAPMNCVELNVRIYTDVRMAEVVELKQAQQLSGVYCYPNDRMYQIDEKLQANHYLAEWLDHLLRHGSVRRAWTPNV